MLQVRHAATRYGPGSAACVSCSSARVHLPDWRPAGEGFLTRAHGSEILALVAVASPTGSRAQPHRRQLARGRGARVALAARSRGWYQLPTQSRRQPRTQDGPVTAEIVFCRRSNPAGRYLEAAVCNRR